LNYNKTLIRVDNNGDSLVCIKNTTECFYKQIDIKHSILKRLNIKFENENNIQYTPEPNLNNGFVSVRYKQHLNQEGDAYNALKSDEQIENEKIKIKHYQRPLTDNIAKPINDNNYYIDSKFIAYLLVSRNRYNLLYKDIKHLNKE